MIQALTADGKLDEFYYNPRGYSDSIHADIGKFNLVGMPSKDGELGIFHSPNDPAERFYYWSSSEAQGHHNEADPDLRSFYVLDIYGKIHDHYRSVQGLVRCVSPPGS